MADNRDDKNNEQPYIREKIVKPKRRSRFLAVAIGGFFGAVLFGLIACFSFVWIYPYVSKLREPDVVETTTAERITLPTHSEEDTLPPEETLPITTEEPTETSDPEETEEDQSEGALLPVDKEWIERLINQKIDQAPIDIRDIENYGREINKVYQSVEKSLVAILPKASVDPVFPSNQGAKAGIMIYRLETSHTILILTDYETASIKDPVVRFAGRNNFLPAQVRGTDSLMGLAVLSVEFDSKDFALYDSLQCIVLGNSYQTRAGSPVIAVGAPFRSYGTMSYGTVLEVRTDQMAVDTIYRMYYTNIGAPEGGTGFLVNVSGQLIGLINSKYKDPAMEGYVAAIATEEITKFLNNISNLEPYSYFGITGQNVTKDIAAATGMPEGIYVTTVQPDSPAYQAGIMAGDIIVGISTKNVTRVSQLGEVLHGPSRHLPGETVIVTLMRLGRDEYKQVNVTVTLGLRQ